MLILALFALLIAALAFGLREPGFGGSTPIKREQTVGQALREAWTYPSFLLLMAGYFVCGFQVMFIGVHMPSYLKDFGMAPHVASYSLALVGLFNIFGTYLAGNLGQKLPKRYLLSGIYGLRSVATVAFLLAPLSPWSVYAFCAAMGFLWLSTVPLTNATITVYDKTGAKKTATTNSEGAYSVNVSGMTAPLLVVAQSSSGDKLLSLVAEISGSQITGNVNELTDWISSEVAIALGKKGALDLLSSGSTTGISADTIKTKTNALRAAVTR